QFPIKIIGNLVAMEQAVGIGIIGESVSVLEDNRITNTGLAGIAVNDSTVRKLNRNKVTGKNAAGIAISSGSKILEKKDNIINFIEN
ncbi:MAG: right-handed parallel beta-helix repeat-containing protein, partial [Candidatus Electrothrix sp. AR4]|nr:right-handed parallel beta-helix repeat-containing protein [Candidatus Electrothrix sp. AR4]